MTTRKEFLAASSTALTVASALSAVTAAPASAKVEAQAPFAFDKQRWDVITGRDAAHRNMYAATRIAGGEILNAMTNTLEAYETSLGTSASSVLSVGVLYHGTSLALALDDATWNDLLLPYVRDANAHFREDVPSVDPRGGNPYYHKRTGYDSSMETLAKRGAFFFLCNNAFNGFAGIVARGMKTSHDEAYARLKKGILPNAMLVPAGVWAVHALQEARFTYLQTSL